MTYPPIVPDRRRADAGERFEFFGEEHEVKPKTDGNKGQWYCISCGVPLDNNLDKDLHCGRRRPRKATALPGGPKGSGARAEHVLAWRSFISGNFEVP